MDVKFDDLLNRYITKLGCTGKALSLASNLSEGTISRYRAGRRVPEDGSPELRALCRGIAQIAREKNISGITEETVMETLSQAVLKNAADPEALQKNFNTLITALTINVSDLSHFLNYDPSYLSLIRNGKRFPSDPGAFATAVADFVVRFYPDRTGISELTGTDPEAIADHDAYRECVAHFLTGRHAGEGPLPRFLKKMDAFDLNDYLRVIRFDTFKVPSAPFQLPTSKQYFGLSAMMEGELDFIKAVVLSKSMAPVTMYSDMPMEEMAEDPDFPKKWLFGMALMLKKGLHFNQLHSIDRSFEEMMLGLTSWIPMYMTGQVSPWYLPGASGSPFLNLLKVSGTAALSGEAVRGFHAEGKYMLTLKKTEVAYYQKRAERLLSRAKPLMEIFREDSRQSFQSFLKNGARQPGQRRIILSSLPLFTASSDLLKQFSSDSMTASQLAGFSEAQRDRVEQILSHSQVTMEIPALKRGVFESAPLRLPLAEFFHEEDLFYTWDMYQEHLEETDAFASKHENLTLIRNENPPFSNIQILVRQGKWVMVSKEKSPAVHFLIRHPNMCRAFENIMVPIAEDRS